MFGIFVLLAFWLAGSFFVEWLHWPIPGSVVGLLALWVVLIINAGVPQWLKQPSSLLIRFLTLLFVPAGVGLIEHWDAIMAHGFAILIIIAVSTLLAAIAMVIIFRIAKVK